MLWTVHIDGSPKRVNHAAVCIDSKIFSFGGYYCSGEYKDWEPISVHVLDTTSFRWAAVNYKKNDVVPFQRFGHTTVAYEQKVYMWGGRNNSVECETLCCFDIMNLEWSSPAVSGMLPNAKHGHSACVIGHKMYIFGGFEYLTEQFSQEVHCLNLKTMQWSLINATGTPPKSRNLHTSVAVDDKMYIFGGRGDSNSPYNTLEEMYCTQVYYLDTTVDRWVCLLPSGTLPEGRRSHSAWLHDGYMYIFGGYNGYIRIHFNDIYRYSIKDNHWQCIYVQGSVPSERRRQVCLIHQDKVYLFGGSSPPYFNQNQRPVANVGANPDRLVNNSDLHVLDYRPSLKTICILTVLKYNLDLSSLPRDIIIDIRSIFQPSSWN